MRLKHIIIVGALIGAAEAVGVPVADLAGAAAVPVFALLVLAGMVSGPEELVRGLGRLVVGLVVLALTAHLMSLLFLEAIKEPAAWGALCLGLAAAVALGVGRVVLKAAAIKLPDSQRVGRAPVRERLRIIDPIEEPPWRAAPEGGNDDEVGVFRRRRE